MIYEGFKEVKTSSLYKYLKEALDFLDVSLLELRSMADRVISDIEDGKEGYDPDLCFMMTVLILILLWRIHDE